MSRILPQVEQEVKCILECGKPVFRDGLCLDHLIEADARAWNDWDAEREMVLESVGCVFGDPVEVPA